MKRERQTDPLTDRAFDFQLVRPAAAFWGGEPPFGRTPNSSSTDKPRTPDPGQIAKHHVWPGTRHLSLCDF